MESSKNKNLIVRHHVVLNDNLDMVIAALDPYFEGTKGYVTSGIRTKEDQLDIICKYALLKGIDHEFPAILLSRVDSHTMFQGKSVYSWQGAWSRLLNRGIIINPPLPAAPLFDYYSGSGNKKGILIGQSPHMRGTAFDIGGGSNGIDDELKVLRIAIPEIPKIRNIKVERDNNAIHVDIFPAA